MGGPGSGRIANGGSSLLRVLSRAAPGPLVTASERAGRESWPRYAFIFVFDALAALVALRLALWLRFEGEVPPRYAEALEVTAPLLAAIHVGCNGVARLHRWAFRLAGLEDAIRVATATAAGTLLAAAAFAVAGVGLPRTIYALEFFVAASSFGALRFLPRAGLRWVGARSRSRAGTPRAIIVGAGHEAELLARDLRRDPAARYQLVGFVAENPRIVRCRIDGTAVLGLVHELPALIRRHRVGTVLLADRGLCAAGVREVVALCATSRVRFKVVPTTWDVEQRLSVAMLQDMSAVDLLPRESVAFDERDIRELVAGRSALVTGAGGSIGGELSRQLARHGVRQLVMVDMNENELYLRRLALAEEFPALEIRAEVADVREAEPLRRLGEKYRPQDVFHAAAHKHVPLMEEAPAEAVKNNVFGTLNAARMADACGAERFVLISTDKAVNPSSVMGVTKRVAELVVRELGSRSTTRMTAVRFGNVLGSAGSVVPIFKRQIARGGPVTVTHPDCTRYFMTIPEAVGLVLLAGLGGHGDLCVLDMGEPIRIADLARSMITLSGHVPGEDVQIAFTGLRPGEKLNEELLTEQEERSVTVRDRVRVTRSPLPPPDLEDRLARLRKHADAGDTAQLLRELRELVPTYRRRSAEPAPPRARPHEAAPRRRPHGALASGAQPPTPI